MHIKFKNLSKYFKKGGGIHIKESTKGSFTKYCKGKVTQKCIDKAKRSGNKKLVKKSIFAENSRKWAKKHQLGGMVPQYGVPPVNQGMITQTMPQTYQTTPTMYPQLGTIPVVQQTNPMDAYQQQMMKTNEALQIYNEKEEEKKSAAEQKTQERNQQAANIGSQIGSMAGKMGANYINNEYLGYLDNQEKSKVAETNKIVEQAKPMINQSISNTTNLSLKGAADFNAKLNNNFTPLKLPNV